MAFYINGLLVILSRIQKVIMSTLFCAIFLNRTHQFKQKLRVFLPSISYDIKRAKGQLKVLLNFANILKAL